ncbi:hypothetical protein EXIGLDRAFT_336762 [Exidia glandulosa HHB12029]|uniref:Uncharacterized protein n=1 Tax=Exidia glandulosa HHB12029 TaxID=1314781 RepID=A0A165CKL1_EXIGL|nr:hypothetical protein EXIGLDRAFT_336762 [Exidia glandulosa HHB12029]
MCAVQVVEYVEQRQLANVRRRKVRCSSISLCIVGLSNGDLVRNESYLLHSALPSAKLGAWCRRFGQSFAAQQVHTLAEDPDHSSLCCVLFVRHTLRLSGQLTLLFDLSVDTSLVAPAYWTAVSLAESLILLRATPKTALPELANCSTIALSSECTLPCFGLSSLLRQTRRASRVAPDTPRSPPQHADSCPFDNA